ncbi:MAG: SIMPL domain-containing protein [Verrucomicrobia bacterium]|nr:SIMPL domain-containing protein [Verrucomicrobiota bacterium]
MSDSSRPQLLGMLAGLFLATGLVLSSMLATTAWLKVKNTQFVTVKGSARKNIRSDLVIWKGSFTTQAATLLAAQRNLKSDADKVAGFLRARGATNILFTPITIEEVKGSLNTNGLTQQQILGYRLTQTVRVESADVERTALLDRESAGLVEAGVLFTAQPPELIYTKAGEAKIEMLGEATKDARVRAEQIAAQGGRGIARLHTADMGVIQIAPIYSGQTSWEGMNDVSSLDKTITAVVTATFALK